MFVVTNDMINDHKHVNRDVESDSRDQCTRLPLDPRYLTDKTNMRAPKFRS